MGLVAEFDIDCDVLPLVGVASAVPDATVLLRLQYNHGNRPPFVVTVNGGSQADIEQALSDAGDLREWTHVGEAGSTRRYRGSPAFGLAEQLGTEIDDLGALQELATADAIVERIEVVPAGWRQTGWFADRETFREFARFWRENAGFSLRRLTRDGEPEPPGDGLTDEQRETLRTAYERGYFEIPRETSLAELGDELGVSASSVSERLRRAQTEVIQETVGPTWPPLSN